MITIGMFKSRRSQLKSERCHGARPQGITSPAPPMCVYMAPPPPPVDLPWTPHVHVHVHVHVTPLTPHITISTHTCTVSVGVLRYLSGQRGPLVHHSVHCLPKYGLFAIT